MSEWQDIATAPKDGTVIDVWCACETLAEGGFRIPGVVWEERFGAFFTDDDGTLADDLTHWMSLPEPPK